jgi:hypothetical protein
MTQRVSVKKEKYRAKDRNLWNTKWYIIPIREKIINLTI